MQVIIQKGIKYLYFEHQRIEITFLSVQDIVVNVWKPEMRPTGVTKGSKREYYTDPSVTITGVEWCNLTFNDICMIKKGIEYAIELLNLEGHNIIAKNFIFNPQLVTYKIDTEDSLRKKYLYDSEINTFTVYENDIGTRYIYLGYGYLMIDNTKSNRTGAFYCWVEIDNDYDLSLISTRDSALVIRDNSNNLVRLNTTVERIKFIRRVKQLQPYKVIAYISNCLHNVRVIPYNGENINNY